MKVLVKVKAQAVSTILLFILFFSLLVGVWPSSKAFAQTSCVKSEEDREVKGGGGIIWPLEDSLYYQWRNLHGVWQSVNSDDCDNNFVFQVKASFDDQSLVSIYQIDPTACKPIATGSGYVVNDRVLKVFMKGRGIVYNLSVRVFKTAGKNVVVMTTAPSAQPELNRSFIIKKVSAKPELMCY